MKNTEKKAIKDAIRTMISITEGSSGFCPINPNSGEFDDSYQLSNEEKEYLEKTLVKVYKILS